MKSISSSSSSSSSSAASGSSSGSSAPVVILSAYEKEQQSLLSSSILSYLNASGKEGLSLARLHNTLKLTNIPGFHYAGYTTNSLAEFLKTYMKKHPQDIEYREGIYYRKKLPTAE